MLVILQKALKNFFFYFSAPEIDSLIGVQGHPVELPCDLTPPNPNEQVYLVLWYRQDEGGEPIYR
jgi:hypothetical protein